MFCSSLGYILSSSCNAVSLFRYIKFFCFYYHYHILTHLFKSSFLPSINVIPFVNSHSPPLFPSRPIAITGWGGWESFNATTAAVSLSLSVQRIGSVFLALIILLINMFVPYICLLLVPSAASFDRGTMKSSVMCVCLLNPHHQNLSFFVILFFCVCYC